MCSHLYHHWEEDDQRRGRSKRTGRVQQQASDGCCGSLECTGTEVLKQPRTVEESNVPLMKVHDRITKLQHESVRNTT